jgi:sulfatase modifying factor 1
MSSLHRLAIVGLVASMFSTLTVANVLAQSVLVGDPNNAADTTGVPNPVGAVADPFEIMMFEFTNEQYKNFLNSVAATDTYSLYNTNMGSNARGGITRSGSPGSYSYAVRPDMGDKPVNFVSWFDAARVANWLENGGTSSSSTETGAYTLGGATSGAAVSRNPGATIYIPTEDQWYKAAYYKGSGTNAGYWDYATQSDTAPTAVTSGSTGIGSAGGVGNSANYGLGADWNSQNGNVTTVGTNGGPSAYGVFDMGGNIMEWNDLNGVGGLLRGLRGGGWINNSFSLSSSSNSTSAPSNETHNIGFRLVPEPATCSVALAGLAFGGFSLWRRRVRS